MYTPDLRNRVKSYDKMRSTIEKANTLALKTKELKQKLKNKANNTISNDEYVQPQSPGNKNNLKRNLSVSPNRRNVNPNNSNQFDLIDSRSFT